MTTTECIFLAAGFIFCVLMLADMGACSMTPQQENAPRSIARQANLKSKSQTAVSG
ncbi:hypothetical protein O5853_26470 [Escherichia coli]|nr:hypothetical protein [Escherichia coli]